MQLIFATHNPGKVVEMKQILHGLPFEVMSADDAGVHEDVVEDGVTFEENALKKARFVSQRTGQWAVADDSGISIDALDGAPGVFSARWAGDDATGEQLVAYTLKELDGIPEHRRSAWFESSAALVSPDGQEWVFTGKVEGMIPMAPRGTPRERLPYDVIFIPEGHTKTFAEMTDDEKNSLSHRGEAFRQLKDFLGNLE
ncbi:MAG: RdgB/HAM1 family non-canonical purine NTP pyrophosphatase [Patescibacteria group bacterium]